MILEPTAVVLYVDNLAISTQFYQDLLGIKAQELSPSFNQFTLSNGLDLGLKVKHTVTPAAENNGGGELAFTLDNNKTVDALYSEWQQNGVTIAQPPEEMPYGYNFLALDPNGYRLRFVSLGKS